MAVVIVLNGENHPIDNGTNISGLVQVLGLSADIVIVELNREVIKKDDYGKNVLKNGDEVEIIRFVGGG